MVGTGRDGLCRGPEWGMCGMLSPLALGVKFRTSVQGGSALPAGLWEPEGGQAKPPGRLAGSSSCSHVARGVFCACAGSRLVPQ